MLGLLWWGRFAWQHRAFAITAAVLVVVAVVCFTQFSDLPVQKFRSSYERFKIALMESDARTHARSVHQTFGDETIETSGEERCRRFIFQQTGIMFNKTRPSWLRNPRTGQRLELDMFSATPRPIAFEFDGAQHQQYTPFYHSSVRDFELSLERDRVKDELCKKNGVELIRIPFNVHDQAEAYVYNHLVRCGLVPVPTPLRIV